MKLLMDGIGSTIPSWKIDVDPDLFWIRTGLTPILAFHPGQTRRWLS
jgi:hypothetical protein